MQKVTGKGSAISFGNQYLAGTYTVTASNFSGTIDMTGNVVNIIKPLPTISLNGINGPDSFTPGTASTAVYDVGDIANATDYIWSYDGTGATITGTGTSVTVDFSATATNGHLSVIGHNGCGDGAATLLSILGTKKLRLDSVILEGLYVEGGLMKQASDKNGLPHWSVDVADHLTVELHDSADYSTIVYTAYDVSLGTNGTANATIPGNYNGRYYITIRHRNSLVIVSANPVSFASDVITQSFGRPSDVYRGRLKSVGKNADYAIYAGDVNQDDIIDLSDVSIIFNVYTLGILSGYIPEDINGNGIIDDADNQFIELGSDQAIKAITP